MALEWSGERFSEPYARMTIKLMKQQGATVRVRKETIHVEAGGYHELDHDVNADWSAAAFWYALVLGRQRTFRLEGLTTDGLQGDEALKDLLKEFVSTRKMGNDTKISSKKAPFAQLDMDLKDTPDLFQPLAIAFATMGIPARFTGLSTLSHKESDRLDSMGQLLQGMGANVFWNENELILGDQKLEYAGTPLATHDDHRLAMSLVRFADIFPFVIIEDPDVVNKSYPDFWVELVRAGYELETLEQ